MTAQRHPLMIATLAAMTALSGCAMYTKTVRNSDLPEAVRVPDGQRQTLYTVGAGEITYECREKKDAAGSFEWA